MRAYLKEITISIAAVLILALAIIAFFRAMNTGKLSEREDIYKLITADANALLIVNRPGVFDRMILENQSLYNIFASEMPDIFLSFIRQNQHLQTIILSYHPQGVVCYIPADSRTISSLEKTLQGTDKTYQPIQQKKNGINYYFTPYSENRFFGFYMHNGVWVGSFSRRLLENAAERHQKKESSLPTEMSRLIKAFDTNAPVNIVFPTEKLDLTIKQGNTIAWQIEDKWLGADLFISDGNLCCFGSLPFQPSVRQNLYKAMGDTIAQRVKKLYPKVSLTFQVDKEDDFVYYTGCTPIPKGR